MPETYVSTDNMLQRCEGVTTYNGDPNIDSCIEYKKGDVLVSNIRPYLKKAWFADRDGGCSPDVLVFRVLDMSKVIPEYLGVALKQNDFFDFMMQGIKGMKMPRGDKAQILNYEVPVPSLLEQKRIVDEVAKYEMEIAKAKAIIDSAPTRKQAILRKYGIFV